MSNNLRPSSAKKKLPPMFLLKSLLDYQHFIPTVTKKSASFIHARVLNLLLLLLFLLFFSGDNTFFVLPPAATVAVAQSWALTDPSPCSTALHPFTGSASSGGSPITPIVSNGANFTLADGNGVCTISGAFSLQLRLQDMRPYTIAAGSGPVRVTVTGVKFTTNGNAYPRISILFANPSPPAPDLDARPVDVLLADLAWASPSGGANFNGIGLLLYDGFLDLVFTTHIPKGSTIRIKNISAVFPMVTSANSYITRVIKVSHALDIWDNTILEIYNISFFLETFGATAGAHDVSVLIALGDANLRAASSRLSIRRCLCHYYGNGGSSSTITSSTAAHLYMYGIDFYNSGYSLIVSAGAFVEIRDISTVANDKTVTVTSASGRPAELIVFALRCNLLTLDGNAVAIFSDWSIIVRNYQLNTPSAGNILQTTLLQSAQIAIKNNSVLNVSNLNLHVEAIILSGLSTEMYQRGIWPTAFFVSAGALNIFYVENVFIYSHNIAMQNNVFYLTLMENLHSHYGTTIVPHLVAFKHVLVHISKLSQCHTLTVRLLRTVPGAGLPVRVGSTMLLDNCTVRVTNTTYGNVAANSALVVALMVIDPSATIEVATNSILSIERCAVLVDGLVHIASAAASTFAATLLCATAATSQLLVQTDSTFRISGSIVTVTNTQTPGDVSVSLLDLQTLSTGTTTGIINVSGLNNDGLPTMPLTVSKLTAKSLLAATVIARAAAGLSLTASSRLALSSLQWMLTDITLTNAFTGLHMLSIVPGSSLTFGVGSPTMDVRSNQLRAAKIAIAGTMFLCNHLTVSTIKGTATTATCTYPCGVFASMNILCSTRSPTITATQTLTRELPRTASDSESKVKTKSPSATNTFSSTHSQSRDSSTVGHTLSPVLLLTKTANISETRWSNNDTITAKGTPSKRGTESKTPRPTETVTAMKTASKSLRPAPPPIPERANALYAGTVVTPFTTRYVYYVSSPIHDGGTGGDGFLSGIPLTFTVPLRRLSVRRYLVTASSNRVLRFLLAPSVGVTASVETSSFAQDLSANRTLSLLLAPTRTVGFWGTNTSNLDIVPDAFTIATADGTQSRSIKQFATLTTPTALTPQPALTTNVADGFACGTIMTAPKSAALQIPTSPFQYASVTLRVSPAAATPQCWDRLRFSGLLYSTAPFASSSSSIAAAERFYAAEVSLDDLYTIIAPFGGSAYNASAATAHFVAASSGAWFGDNQTAFFGGGVASWNLIGDPTNPRRLPAPITSKHFSLVYPAARHLQGDAMRIAADTANTILCRLGDTTAYAGTLIEAHASFAIGSAARCYEFDTVDDAHMACEDDSACSGFSTIRMPANPITAWPPRNYTQFKELPLCLHRAGASTSTTATDVHFYDRMFYAKPSSTEIPRCSVSVVRGGQIAVYVQQTSLASSQVAVRINGKVSAVCGQGKLFAGGFAGLDGACGLAALCYTGPVSAFSVVEVSGPAKMLQGGCDHSLSVLVTQTSVDLVQANATVEPPIQRLNTSGMAARPIRQATTRRSFATPANSPDADVIKLFVYGAARAAVEIFQTGYRCNLHAGGRCPSPFAVEAIAAPLSTFGPAATSTTTSSSKNMGFGCQRCGGASAGFHASNRAGRSDECDTGMFCGDYLPMIFDAPVNSGGSMDTCGSGSGGLVPAAASQNTPLLFKIRADFSSLASATDDCRGLAALVYMGSLNTTTVGTPTLPVPTFPLLLNNAPTATTSTAIETTFRPHIGVPSGEIDAQQYLMRILGLASLPQPALARILIGVSSSGASSPQGIPAHDAYFVPWGSAAVFGGRWSRPVQEVLVDPNTTQICMIDHAGGLAARCIFFIPKGSTRVRVSAAQNDFARSHMEVSFVLGNREAATGPVRCGYTAASATTAKFGTRVGSEGRCQTFETCTDQFIYMSDSDAASATDGTVIVDIPATAEYRGCDFLGLFKVEFSAPPLVAPSPCADGFVCPGNRACIPRSKLCDQIQDCPLNDDEASCYDFHELPGEAFCAADPTQSSATRIPNANTFSSCRREAVGAGSSAFTLEGGACIVYNATIVPVIFSQPLGYMCPSAGQTFVSLPGGADTFRLCRSSLHCNGHGVVASNTSAPSCTCNCFAGYRGGRCAQVLSLDTITHAVVQLPVAALSEATSISLQVVTAALQLSSTLVQIDCTDVFPAGNDLSVNVACAISASRAADAQFHARRLLNPETWTVISSSLSEQYHPRVKRITARTIMNPVTALTPCVGKRDPLTSSIAECSVDVNADQLMVAVRSNVTVLSMRFVVEQPLSSNLLLQQSRRFGLGRDFAGAADVRSSTSTNSQVKTVTCIPAPTQAAGGCIRSTCSVNIPTSRGANIRVSEIIYANATPLTGLCADPGIAASAQSSYGQGITNAFLQTLGNSSALNIETDFSSFLSMSIVLFVIGTCSSLVFALVCACKWKRQLDEVQDLANCSDLPPLEQAKMGLIIPLYLRRQKDGEGACRADRLASIGLVLGVTIGIVAGALTIYYKTAFDVSSNFSAMVEEYSDGACSASETAYMPRRVFVIPGGETECVKMKPIGESTGAVYALGHCAGASGVYTAHLQHGGSPGLCSSAPVMTFPSGSCVPVQSVFADAARHTFVKIVCGSSVSLFARVRALTALTLLPDVFVSGVVDNLPPSLEFTTNNKPKPTDGGSGGQYVSHVAVAGSALTKVSSQWPNTVDSHAPMNSDFDGDINAARLVLQSTQCTFSENTTVPVCDEISAAEAQLHPALFRSQPVSLPSSLLGLAPTNEDEPLGHIFGGFGTTAAVTWQGAGPTAHRYYGVQGSVFDVGAHFPRSGKLEAVEDGEGYTISLFLRAGPTTLGFAYAVTDAFENVQDGTVYPLERLARIIDNGEDPSAWFNHTYSVYQALYVNGPGSTLTLAYADGAQSVANPLRVSQLEFDLAAIGMQRVMNGLWHHIAIAFVVENSRVRAQLIVDGETSYAKKGWSVCVNALPTPIAHFADTAPIFSSVSDTVRAGGVLVTGYLNGGVYALTATPREVLNTEFLQRGTTAMREHSAFPRTKTIILGAVLLALGTACTVVVVFATYKIVLHTAIHGNEDGAIFGRSRDTADMFYACMDQAIRKLASEQQELQRKSADAASDDASSEAHNLFISTQPEPLLPIRFATALRWAGLSVAEFAVAMEEVALHAQKGAAECLLLFLLQRHQSNPRRGMFTVEEWNACVMSDAARVAEASTAVEERLARLPSILRRCVSPCVLFGVHDDAAAEKKLLGNDYRHPSHKSRPSTVTQNRNSGDLPLGAETTTGARRRRSSVVRSFYSDVEFEEDAAQADHPYARRASSCSFSSRSSSSPARQRRGRETPVAVGFFSPSTSDFVAFGDTNVNDASDANDKSDLDEKQESSSTARANNAHPPEGHAENDGAALDENLVPGDGAAELSGQAKAHQGLFSGGNGAGFSSPATGATSATTLVGEILAPMIAVFQSVYVWSTSIALPSLYDDYFRGIFSFLSLDLTNVFASIPTLITPLLQLAVGLLTIAMVLYYMLEDNNRFQRALIRYVWRRDELEGSEAVKSSQIENFPDIFIDALDDLAVPEPCLPLHTLPFADARRIDVFRGKITDKNEAFSDGVCAVSTYSGETFTVAKSQENSLITISSSGNTKSLQEVTTCCRRHPWQRLTKQLQTDIWPYSNPPTCCMVVDGGANGGRLCGEQCGVIYSCGHHHIEEADEEIDNDNDDGGVGNAYRTQKIRNKNTQQSHRRRRHKRRVDTVKRSRIVVCSYALCERHCHLTLPQLALSRLYGYRRTVLDNGVSWLLCILFVTVANAAYTPFIKTALMILGCHPFYQCEFKNCAWGGPRANPKFALAVYLSMVVVVVFGAGFPLALTMLLRRRKHLMQPLFLDPQYEGRYMTTLPATAASAPETSEPLNLTDAQNDAQNENNESQAAQEMEMGEKPCDNTTTLDTARATMTVIVSPSKNVDKEVEEEGERQQKSGGQQGTESMEAMAPIVAGSSASHAPPAQLRLDEWARFAATDTTGLAQQYQSVFYQWLFFPGIVMVFKVFTLAPAIFLEPRSFEQRLGVALTEVLFAAFLFGTRTQMSPVVLLAIRAASMHQLLLLGLQNIHLVTEHETNTSLAPAMISTTLVYCLLSVVIISTTVLVPTLKAHFQGRKMKRLLNAHGVDFTRSVSLYLDPNVHRSAAEDCAAHSLPPLVENKNTSEKGGGSGGDFGVI